MAAIDFHVLLALVLRPMDCEAIRRDIEITSDKTLQLTSRGIIKVLMHLENRRWVSIERLSVLVVRKLDRALFSITSLGLTVAASHAEALKRIVDLPKMATLILPPSTEKQPNSNRTHRGP